LPQSRAETGAGKPRTGRGTPMIRWKLIYVTHVYDRMVLNCLKPVHQEQELRAWPFLKGFLIFIFKFSDFLLTSG
jgi:hypothetical protein